jgi:hypothetical protein
MHHITRSGCCGVTPRGDTTTHDVSIRDHPDEAIVLANGNGSDVVVTHECRELLNRDVWIDPVHGSLSTPLHALMFSSSAS